MISEKLTKWFQSRVIVDSTGLCYKKLGQQFHNYHCASFSIIGNQLVYPQFLGGTELTESSVGAATRKVVDILELTEKKYFGCGSKYLCGDKLTVADVYVATILLQLEWIENVDMKLWPMLNRWLKEVRKQEQWDTVHAKHREFVEALKNVPLESTWKMQYGLNV